MSSESPHFPTILQKTVNVISTYSHGKLFAKSVRTLSDVLSLKTRLYSLNDMLFVSLKVRVLSY